jgi:hypothetical protein
LRKSFGTFALKKKKIMTIDNADKNEGKTSLLAEELDELEEIDELHDVERGSMNDERLAELEHNFDKCRCCVFNGGFWLFFTYLRYIWSSDWPTQRNSATRKLHGLLHVWSIIFIILFVGVMAGVCPKLSNESKTECDKHFMCTTAVAPQKACFVASGLTFPLIVSWGVPWTIFAVCSLFRFLRRCCETPSISVNNRPPNVTPPTHSLPVFDK